MKNSQKALLKNTTLIVVYAIYNYRQQSFIDLS